MPEPTTPSPSPSSPGQSPETLADIRATLRKELVEVQRRRAEDMAVAMPAGDVDLEHEPFPVDSLVVVDLLCAVDEATGLTLPNAIVEKGGYKTIAEALEKLMAEISAHLKHGKAPKPKKAKP